MFLHTKREDVGKFRTPSLRNVALIAFYMRHGSVVTLDEVLDLAAFLRGLTDAELIHDARFADPW